MKKVLKITLIIVGFLVGIVMSDTIQAIIFNNSPLINIRKDYNGGNINYINKGLIVDHYYCTNKEEKTLLKGTKYYCPSIKEFDLEVKEIVDTTKELKNFSCDTMLEKFFSDDNYVYYYNCTKSKYVLVRYTNGYEETVKDALKNKRITVKDLDLFNIVYIKQIIRNNDEDNTKSCLNNKLGGYITTEISEIDELELSSLINIDLTTIDYSFIGKGKGGIYAIIKTEDNVAIKELDKYFDRTYIGYQSIVYNDYKIYIYNKINDFNFNDDLAQCFE